MGAIYKIQKILESVQIWLAVKKRGRKKKTRLKDTATSKLHQFGF